MARCRTHTVETTDSSMDGAAVQHDPARRNEWSLWNVAESTSILAPTEAELRSRLRSADVERIKTLLWPRPLTLTGIEIVPIQGPQKKKGTLYSGPRKKQIAEGTGLVWLREPVWDTTFSRDADYYAYLKDRYRPSRNEPAVLFPDDLTPLKGQKNRYQVAIRRGYNGPWVWTKEGRLQVERADPASLFDHRIGLPQLPVGRYVIDTKVWKPNGELAGTRQFTFWVGESKASLPAEVAPTFQLTTGSPMEVLPTGTTAAALKIILGDGLPLGDGRQCRLRVVDYTGKTIVDKILGAERTRP